MWWFESRKLFEYYKKKSCVSNRTDTSALSEWMVVRPFRSLVQLRGSPNASGLQTHDLFLEYSTNNFRLQTTNQNFAVEIQP